MATKAENIETLYQAGVDTKTNLKKMEPESLEKMVAELEKEAETTNKKEDKVVDTDSNGSNEHSPKEVGESSDTTEGSDINGNVAEETTIQLSIFTEFIYHVKNEEATLKVENLGNGDVYVSMGKVNVGDKAQRLLKGESRVFEGTGVVNFMAASQPEVKITEIK
ncbi:hypothetical protein [Bacillus haynesii]|uniref:hypothetical protein n=1 Tax=Bacillus haynesii TaxID=1925021 RepID=UPI002281AE94|nr:hypothetical protein [Bacillus haynesii]MCY7861134.1 hypothetical protein [Bacillus haynesii]MCY8549160.1 hypothetical protein [Bacillus haynesii]